MYIYVVWIGWYLFMGNCSSHPSLNAYAIIPRGPDALSDMLLPHNRNSIQH